MRYRVIINGRNFRLRFADRESQNKTWGFYTTRDVEADSFEDAELAAIEVIRNEDGIKSITINPTDDPPMLYLDDIRILGDEEESINGSGYTYYPEDESES